MADETVLTPDIAFIKGLKAAGADTLKKCYQCATCSVVCPISPDDNPFPRKEMVMAQWGLKEDLAKDPDIWLCHNCNDCTKYCPRGARPGDVLSILRKNTIQENAFPKFMGKIVGDPNPKNIIIALAIPLVLFLVILGAIGTLKIPDGEIVYSKLVPVLAIDAIFITVAALAVGAFVISMGKFWKGLNKANPVDIGALVPSLIATVKEILGHSKFKKCDANKDRSIAHMFVFYGFVGLFITTNWALVYEWVFHRPSPYPLYDPLKIFGNVSAIALLIGALLVIFNRMKDRGFKSITSSFDWTFAIVILLVGVTGILSEVIRLANIATIAYPMYIFHLVFVFYIIAYIPYSKLAHLVYRTVAITHAKMAKRDVE